MKALIALTILLVGCAKNPAHDLAFKGTANRFTQTQKLAFNGTPAIENSMVHFGGTILSFFDPSANSSMFMSDLGTDGKSFGSPRLILESGARFSYVMAYNGTLYNFVTRQNVVHLMTSTDGVTWAEQGPVLTPSSDPHSPYHQLWNVGVAVDSSGTFHMLIESGDSQPAQRGVGLTYATAQLINGRLDFDPGKSSAFMVLGGGNPFVTYVEGKGLLVIHGQAYTPANGFGDEWYTTASTFDGTTWQTHTSAFSIGAVGVHVCDPHAIETPSGVLLTMSVDQNSIYKTEAAGETFAALYQRLRGN